MAGKLTAASAVSPVEELSEEYMQAAEDTAEHVDHKEQSLSAGMHSDLATVVAHLLYKHYDVQHVALGFSDELYEDHFGGIRVFFSEKSALSGRERLETLDNLSRFLADLSKTANDDEGLIIEAATSDSIFEIAYDPVILGNALVKLTEQYAPDDMEIGQHLRSAAVLLERVNEYIPACKMN